MKKVLIVIAVLVLVIGGVSLAIFNSLNKTKTSISADTFSSIMEDKGYAVIETTSQFEQYPNYVSKSYLAQKDDYQIEFYELTSEENAISMYNANRAKFESQKTNVSAQTSVSINNYSTYSLTTNGKYKYLSRIDNTLVYIDVYENYKDVVKDLMEEIEY